MNGDSVLSVFYQYLFNCFARLYTIAYNMKHLHWPVMGGLLQFNWCSEEGLGRMPT